MLAFMLLLQPAVPSAAQPADCEARLAKSFVEINSAAERERSVTTLASYLASGRFEVDRCTGLDVERALQRSGLTYHSRLYDKSKVSAYEYRIHIWAVKFKLCHLFGKVSEFNIWHIDPSL